MVETDVERNVFLADFGVPIVGSFGTVTGIFDNEFVDVDLDGEVSVAGTQPVVRLKSTDADLIPNGTVMTIEGFNYISRIKMPDGTGMTMIALELQ